MKQTKLTRGLLVLNAIQNSIETKEKILKDGKMMSMILSVVEEIVKAFKHDKKMLLCGNGGSAADAQHIAGELSVKFYFKRRPLSAEALNTNISHITATANDLSYDEVFSRLVEAQGRKGDILVAISTSGNSPNIIKAIKVAKKQKMIIVGLTGEDGGKMNGICDYLIKVPSSDTPRIQESHILIGHIICELVEKEMFGDKNK